MSAAETFLTDINVTDIQSEQMQMVAESCGLADALALMERLPGLELYIPASAKKAYNWSYVKEHYDGYNAATLAGRLGLPTRDAVIRLSKRPAPMRDDLSNEHIRLVAENCGQEVAQRLARHFPGERFYIPINGLSIARKKYIERAFNGTNTQELALKCHVSERYIRKVISDKHESTAQTSLFD